VVHQATNHQWRKREAPDRDQSHHAADGRRALTATRTLLSKSRPKNWTFDNGFDCIALGYQTVGTAATLLSIEIYGLGAALRAGRHNRMG